MKQFIKNIQQHFAATSDALRCYIKTMILHTSNYVKRALPCLHETDKDTEKF